MAQPDAYCLVFQPEALRREGRPNRLPELIQGREFVLVKLLT